MSTKNIKLSVLDQSPVRKGASANQALQETAELAKLAENLGYTRFWVSEHHNTTSLAGSAPEVLMAHLATITNRIRIGSGGVMLPNHSALKVAENFRLLESLFPGRIDLGIGRAPGTDRITASVLNPSNQFSEQDFIEQLADLQYYFHDGEGDTPDKKIKAIPMADTVPAQWLLTSSGQSAYFAAHFGMGLAFAHFINPVGGPQAVKYYHEHFKPSADLPSPAVAAAFFVFCSESEEKIRSQQAVMDYRFLQLEKGKGLTPVNYEDVKDEVYNYAEQERIIHNRKRMVTGTPQEIKQKLSNLADEYNVDELIAVTITEDFNDRLASYELLAGLFL